MLIDATRVPGLSAPGTSASNSYLFIHVLCFDSMMHTTGPWKPVSYAGTNIDAMPTYPASYNNSNILSVIATDQANRLANYSNYGHHNSDIAAPGSQILSTILHGQVRRTLGLCQECTDILTCLL